MPVKLTKNYIQVSRKIAQFARGDLNIQPSEMKILADKMAVKIRVRTRLGRGVEGNPFPRLSKMYVTLRGIAKKEGILSDQTTPKKSNVTFTGQLLNSIFAIVKARNEFTIKVKEGRSDSKIRNSDLITELKKKGRNFFGFSEAEIAFLRNEVIRLFKRKFRL